VRTHEGVDLIAPALDAPWPSALSGPRLFGDFRGSLFSLRGTWEAATRRRPMSAKIKSRPDNEGNPQSTLPGSQSKKSGACWRER